MITIEEVEKLRREWLELQNVATDEAAGFAAIAGAVVLNNPGNSDFPAGRAAVAATDAKQRAKWLEYQDALTRLQAQQAAEQVAASNKLARTNKNLAWAIAIAAMAQAIAAWKCH